MVTKFDLRRMIESMLRTIDVPCDMMKISKKTTLKEVDGYQCQEFLIQYKARKAKVYTQFTGTLSEFAEYVTKAKVQLTPESTPGIKSINMIDVDLTAGELKKILKYPGTDEELEKISLNAVAAAYQEGNPVSAAMFLLDNLDSPGPLSVVLLAIAGMLQKFTHDESTGGTP